MNLVKRHHSKVAWGLVLALLISNLIGFTGGFVSHNTLVRLWGRHGLVEPPVVALSAHGSRSTGQKAAGLVAPHIRIRPKPLSGGFLPVAYDLSQDNPPVANQGNVESCVTWATGYFLRGWYARRYGQYFPGDGAAMYLYSQITRGQNIPTLFTASLDLLYSQGVDSRAHYAHGDTDYWDQPNSAEVRNAAQYRISGYTALFLGDHQGYGAQSAIEAAISGGNPVMIGIPINAPFWNAGPASYYIDSAAGTYYGNHAVGASKYDANGLWIQNQWGTGYGLNGWVELSWNFVDTWVFGAYTISVPHAAPTPTPTPRPTRTPTPRPTLTPLPRPTRTPTPRPTVTPTPKPASKYWIAAVDQYLRSRPDPASHRGYLVRKGYQLKGKKAPNFTPHWRGVCTLNDHCGWYLSSNIAP